jgi:iron complex outermembrane receptor protein
VQTGRYVSICRSSTSLGQIPKYAATVSSDYEHPVGPFTGFVRGLVSYQSSAYFPQTAWTQKDQALVDLYVGLREPDNAWELSLYAKNLLDNQQQDTEAGGYFSVGQDSGYHMGTVLKGRELGLTLRYTFGN